MRISPTKRGWKRLAVGAAIVVALALIANGSMAWWVEHQLQSKIAAIRAAGDPASIADLAPEPIPADENAAAILQQLGPRLGEFAKDHVRFLDKTPAGAAYEERRRRSEPPSPEQIEAIRAIVDKYPDLDAGLAAAAACNQYASLADFTLGPTDYLQKTIDEPLAIRTAARFTGWRMDVLVADGEPQQAAELGLESLRIARLHDAEPLLINYLIGQAIRSIAAQGLYDAMDAGPISPQLHVALDEELARHDDPQRLVRAFKTERAYSAALTASLSRDHRVNPVWMSIVGWPVKWLYVGAIDSYDRHFMLATKPWGEICRALGPPRTDPPPTGGGVLADLMLPSLKVAYEASARNLATLRALRIFNALTQYRDEHGREASGLDDLSLPKEVTIDPFSGEPLKLRRTDDGWIIYSVMQNGVDDGGDFKGLKDYGLAPRKHRATE